MCIFPCTNTCAYIQTHVTYIQTYRHAHIHIRLMHIHIHTFKYPDNTHTYMHVQIQTHNCAHNRHRCTYIHTYRWTHMHIHSHIHIHIGTKTHRYLHTFQPTYLFFLLLIVTIASSPGEMAWKLRMHTVFPENWGPIPRTYRAAHNHL